MRTFLLLSVLLSSVSFLLADSPDRTALSNPSNSTGIQADANSGQPSTELGRKQLENNTAGVHWCLHIHAFIFQTEDDSVPKLVGETTCMSVGGEMKRVKGAGTPRLLPAAGGGGKF